jgi:hypothetical protein
MVSDLSGALIVSELTGAQVRLHMERGRPARTEVQSIVSELTGAQVRLHMERGRLARTEVHSQWEALFSRRGRGCRRLSCWIE